MLVMANNARKCCCSFDCCLCGACCFSTNSTIDYSLTDLTIPGDPGDFGDLSDFPTSVVVNDAPFRECPTGSGRVAWYVDREVDAHQLEVHGAVRTCPGGSWAGGGFFSEDDEFGVPVKSWNVEAIESTAGDCCGIDATVQYRILKHERTRQESEEEPGTFFYTEWVETAEQHGFAHIVVTVKNNGCCKNGSGTCDKADGECDGTCSEERGI